MPMSSDGEAPPTVASPLRAPAEAALLAVVVCAAVAAVTLGFGLPGERAATLFCVNLCAVLAFQTFSGNSGVVSFGHTAFMGIGAYVSAWITMPPSMLRATLPNLPAWLGGYEAPTLIALAVVAVVGAVVALIVGLPVARLSGASAAIATLGLLIIVYSVLAGARDFTRGNQAFYGIPRTTDIWVAGTAAFAFILAARLFRDSRVGLCLRAVRDDETAATASGLDPVRLRLAAWTLSGAMGAVAGALYGHMLGAFTPRDFSFDLAFGLVAMMIVGGMGTVTGALSGVALVMALQEGLQRLEGGFAIGPFTTPQLFGLPVVGASLAILIVLLYRPAGLFGLRELSLPDRFFARRPAPPGAAVPERPSRPIEIEHVSKSFGGLAALTDVTARLVPGRVTGLIGPNGAGKSTLVNVMAGLSPATAGRVLLGDARLDQGPPQATARAGVARTFQNIRLFEALSVEENVIVAALAQGLPPATARAFAARELAAVGLAGSATRISGALPYGSRRRLEIARALAARPEFLLLDEPAAGMNPEETADLAARLRDLPATRGVGILLIDHDLPFVMALCDHVIVVNRGEVIATGTPAEVQRHPAVIEAYLGTRATGGHRRKPAPQAPSRPTPKQERPHAQT